MELDKSKIFMAWVFCGWNYRFAMAYYPKYEIWKDLLGPIHRLSCAYQSVSGDRRWNGKDKWDKALLFDITLELFSTHYYHFFSFTDYLYHSSIF